MKSQVSIITPLHQRTKRDYLARMCDDKVQCMEKASEYGYDYWDGERRYGYGGYRYDGRWLPVAETLIATYDLGPASRILDVGCGKAHLLYEIMKLLPKSEIYGIDPSSYALENAPAEIRPYLSLGTAEKPYVWPDGYFDLVISLNCLHNLGIASLADAVREIERVGRSKYIVVESYRNNSELFALQCWALTCRAFFSTDDWIWLFDRFGYTGDYEFIYF